jgi:soluble lytic murein transglycosylase-like protein
MVRSLRKTNGRVLKSTLPLSGIWTAIQLRHRTLHRFHRMTDKQEPAIVAVESGVGIRHSRQRRRRHRRTGDRTTSGRRRGDRRRKTMRTMLLAAAALATTHSVKTKTTPLQASVSVSMNDFRALQPERAYDDIIAEAAAEYDVDPALIRAVMRAESAFNPMVVSPAGAQGLMQLMPALAEELGVVDPFDPRQNIMGGARYLRWLLDHNRGNIPLTLAGYNAGPAIVAKYRKVPPFRETQNYVKKITGFIADARREAVMANE